VACIADPAPSSPALRATRAGGHALALLPPLLAAAYLRLAHLAGQVIGGDELHAVRAALAQPLKSILVTYQLTDTCIPLTALDRLLVDHGVRLSEIVLRLPMLLSGLLALPLLAWLARGRVDPRTRYLWLWLLALSPLLVLYSRIARSYMPMVLLACGAALAFERWWNGGSAAGGGGRPAVGLALAYVALGALAIWFHLGAAPLVGAPLLFALGDLVGAGRRRAAGAAVALGRLVLVGAGLLAACALFLVPARASLLRLIAGKHQAQTIPAATWTGVARLQAGTASPVLAIVFWLAALVGLGMLLGRRRRFALFTLTLAVLQLLGILLLSPIGLASAVVLDRYLLPLLPIVLLWVAAALAHPWWPRQSALGRAGQGLGAAGFLAALLAAGPFADAGARAGSFLHHNDFVAFVRPRATVPGGALPLPYRAAGGGALVELPWPPVWDFGRAFYAYQEVHGLPVLVAPPPGILDDPRLRLRNWVEASPEALAGSGARWVIVHLRLGAEEDRLRGSPGRPMPAPLRELYAREGQRMAALLSAGWGPPTCGDASAAVVAWDLSRRASGRRGGGTHAAAPAASAAAASSNPSTKPRGR
jgi:MYXO-CTERM domain-containing protein